MEKDWKKFGEIDKKIRELYPGLKRNDQGNQSKKLIDRKHEIVLNENSETQKKKNLKELEKEWNRLVEEETDRKIAEDERKALEKLTKEGQEKEKRRLYKTGPKKKSYREKFQEEFDYADEANHDEKGFFDRLEKRQLENIHKDLEGLGIKLEKTSMSSMVRNDIEANFQNVNF